MDTQAEGRPSIYLFIFVNPLSGDCKGEDLVKLPIQHFRLRRFPQVQVEIHNILDDKDRTLGLVNIKIPGGLQSITDPTQIMQIMSNILSGKPLVSSAAPSSIASTTTSPAASPAASSGPSNGSSSEATTTGQPAQKATEAPKETAKATETSSGSHFPWPF
ncbi:hypothetical protein CU097_015264 [Rhizopus azygosporus]|uniref:Uncharacterized protein n=1 Tax=Rhizopus azygosporus TaxID=86630 RepID=A0A367K9N6_RHIAZ|nr:hypothetical protein CU097_015264 [Rhizopus azygosporus]